MEHVATPRHQTGGRPDQWFEFARRIWRSRCITSRALATVASTCRCTSADWHRAVPLRLDLDKDAGWEPFDTLVLVDCPACKGQLRLVIYLGAAETRAAVGASNEASNDANPQTAIPKPVLGAFVNRPPMQRPITMIEMPDKLAKMTDNEIDELAKTLWDSLVDDKTTST